jgi:hypothetical protein
MDDTSRFLPKDFRNEHRSRTEASKVEATSSEAPSINHARSDAVQQ